MAHKVNCLLAAPTETEEGLWRYVQETQPDQTVVGRPGHGMEHEAPPAFETDAIAEFAYETTQKTG